MVSVRLPKELEDRLTVLVTTLSDSNPPYISTESDGIVPIAKVSIFFQKV